MRGVVRVLLILSLYFLSSCATMAPVKQSPSWNEQTWTSVDGASFPYTKWMSESEPRAVIIAIHGISGAASDFFRLGEYFQKRGVTVFGIELRGQGNDPEVLRRGDICSGDEWIRDLEAFGSLIADQYPKTPIIWYGESLGSVILVAATEKVVGPTLRNDGMVLASPIVDLQGLPKWKELSLRVAAVVAPGKRIALQDLAGDQGASAQVVSTTTHEEQIEKTPHAVKTFTLRLLGNIGRMIRQNHECAGKLEAPLLVIHGANEVFMSPEVVERYFESYGSPNKKRILYKDSYHLLLHDVETPQVLADVDAWLERQLE